MATQQTSTSSNTRRSGIFSHSIRKVVIVLMIVLFLVGGIIGIIGVLENWGVVSNLLSMLLTVVSGIAGILTFWSPTRSNEASAPESPRHFWFESKIKLGWGQQDNRQQVPSSSTGSASQEQIPKTIATNTQQQPSKNIPQLERDANEFPGASRQTLAIETLDSPAGPRAARPIDFLQAGLLQDNQLPLGDLNPHQPLPKNLSSQELLNLARSHIQSAREAITVAARPFAGKGTLFSRHYRDAIARLNISIEHMRYLLELLPLILTRLLAQESAPLFTKHEEIKVEIYRMIDEAERLILLLQKENEKNRQNIVQKAGALEKLLQELLPAFAG